MPPRLEVELAETEQFQLDCALYGLEGEPLDSALSVLRSNPIVGTPRPESASLWDWTFRRMRITYAASEEFSRIVLLRVVPVETSKSEALSTILRVVRIINDVRRLFGY
ncbi:hypothetical protein [Aurantimonas sp. VKM B-3413]|uniref:hypothetical protein n=1 Tax=Aurantimonas sp. VKM B-3413 TaxID=2779401 RepID=UPI001E2B3A43|nr:hypothetical protein [Aurantimonas sp. VKM B-3413]MCB8837892.1 hypothetical protein [Aurantimonas sp. VKM B-3413]